MNLSDGDIIRAQILYGPNLDNPQKILIPRYVPDQSDDAPDLCEDANINTISYSFNEAIYMFKNLDVFELNGTEMMSNSPRPIIWQWKSFRGPVQFNNDFIFKIEIRVFIEELKGK